MYKEIRGDLFTTEDRYIMHGCNCQGVMGAGVALLVREKYPEAYEEYVKYCRSYDDEDLLGDCLGVTINPKRTILNAFTQLYTGSGKQVSYDAIDEVTKRLNTIIPHSDISMPMIGAGLAGGNWEIIRTIIQQNMTDVNVTVWIYP
jgi:O-acetyl-ADP-ribose deacetylase (regulator of RNase III)